MKRLLPSLLVLSLSLPFAHAQDDPDTLTTYPFTYNGISSEVVMNMHTWTMAAHVADLRGGHLVHLDSKEECDSVWDAIMNGAQVPFNYTIVNDGGGIAYVWIGGTDQDSEGMWLWDGDDDGQGPIFWMGQGAAGAGGGYPIGGAFNLWGGASTGTPNEPDDFLSNQDAAAIGLEAWPQGTGGLGIAGEWNDIDQANTLYYVIEYDNVGIDVPASQDLHAWYSQESGDILVSFDNQSKARVILYTIDGRTVRSLSFRGSAGRIPAQGLTPGIYLLSVEAGGNIFVEKVLVY